MTFDIYAFADYSASSPVHEQRKHIVLALYDRSTGEHKVIKGLSRIELSIEICVLLKQAACRKQRVLFGFDHSYSFPFGFYHTLSGQSWTDWTELLRFLGSSHDSIPSLGEPLPFTLYHQLVKQHHQNQLGLEALEWIAETFRSAALPRTWAESVNHWFLKNHLSGSGGGPFWGPNFYPQLKKPQFPFNPGMQEKRVVEMYSQKLNHKSMKPIYQIGGNGSVGLQALYGISYLHQLLLFCKSHAIPVFSWPFDGWQPPDSHHVLVEIYPSLYNKGRKTDEEDAKACVCWMKERDEQAKLLEKPSFLSAQESCIVLLEGWVPGVMPDEFLATFD